MIIETYQSKNVLRILKSGEIYRAKPNLSLKGEYAALVDMLGLKCECPIFGVIRGRKQHTFGKVSGSVKITLDVPDKFVHLTEFNEWADFIYAYKFTKPGNYRALQADCEEITVRRFNEILENLTRQKKPGAYKYPQVVLEKINPSWMKKYKFILHTTHWEVKWEALKNRFRR